MPSEAQALATVQGIGLTREQLQAIADLLNQTIDGLVAGTTNKFDDIIWRIARPLVAQAEQALIDKLGGPVSPGPAGP